MGRWWRIALIFAAAMGVSACAPRTEGAVAFSADAAGRPLLALVGRDGESPEQVRLTRERPGSGTPADATGTDPTSHGPAYGSRGGGDGHVNTDSVAFRAADLRKLRPGHVLVQRGEAALADACRTVLLDGLRPVPQEGRTRRPGSPG